MKLILVLEGIALALHKQISFSILLILLMMGILFDIFKYFNLQVKVQITFLLPILCKAAFT
jgi:hypothetical protein